MTYEEIDERYRQTVLSAEVEGDDEDWDDPESQDEDEEFDEDGEVEDDDAA